jgi:hypothetical protein
LVNKIAAHEWASVFDNNRWFADKQLVLVGILSAIHLHSIRLMIFQRKRENATFGSIFSMGDNT